MAHARVPAKVRPHPAELPRPGRGGREGQVAQAHALVTSPPTHRAATPEPAPPPAPERPAVADPGEGDAPPASMVTPIDDVDG